MFKRIISLENLFEAWVEFRREKSHKQDVMLFEMNLEDHIFKLHKELVNGTYKHGGYFSFFVCDPKRRHIHKAAVRDRLLHHAIVRVLDPLWDKKFIYDSWSSRKTKGTHRAIKRLHNLALRLSRNHTHTLWALKLDIRKFFASVDHDVLLSILNSRITDKKVMLLLEDIIRSYKPGLPLGNLTSQLFANIYMDQFDQFVKHELKFNGYIRYADDFILLNTDKELLINCISTVEDFLHTNLRLNIHPDKISIKAYAGGVDYLGYVCFPHHRVLRTKTKRRMFRRINENNLSSYNGLLKHCRSHELLLKLKKAMGKLTDAG